MPDALQELESEIPNLHLVRNVDTVTLLHQAAAVMTFYSTVAIDAALLGKPILLFNRQDLMHTVMPLYDMGAALCCTSEQQDVYKRQLHAVHIKIKRNLIKRR